MTDGARDQIVEAAFRLFVRDGYDATSIDRVLAEVPFTKGALYHHFSGKQALLDAVIERFLTDSIAAPRDATEVDPIAHVERMVDDYVAAINAIAADATPLAYFAFLTQVAPRVHDALRAAHDHTVDSLAATLSSTTQPQRRQLAADIVALIEGTVMLTVLRGDPVDTAEIKRSAARMLDSAAH